YKGELVGIATFMKNDFVLLKGKQYQLRGMATLKEARGKGLGKLLINEALVFLKSKKVDFLWCNAREAAVPFYKKLGFAIKGEAFLIEKVGFHFKMYIKI
ncbi:MAG: GNAT family N-acetyltransferase, partial [Tenacibaculum sp.]